MDSLVAIDSKHDIAHASNFHSLVAKLLLEYEETVRRFTEEVDHLRASAEEDLRLSTVTDEVTISEPRQSNLVVSPLIAKQPSCAEQTTLRSALKKSTYLKQVSAEQVVDIDRVDLLFRREASNDDDDEHSTLTDDENDTRLAEQWLALVEGILGQMQHYVIHPGWLDTDRPSTNVKYSRRALRQVGTISSNVPDSEREALSLHEKKIHEGSSARTMESKASWSSKGNFYFQATASSRILSKVKKFLGFGRTTKSNGRALHPQSPLRRFWIALCCFVFFYEFLSLTMSPFGFLDGSTGKTLEWISAFYWSCDIVMNFVTGIYRKGIVETRLPVIARSYAQTWFMFDLVVVVFQYLGLLIQATKFNATIVLRFVRVIRSVRVYRIFYWLRDELGLSRSAMARAKLFYAMIALYCFVHVFSCILYEVGQADGGWASKYRDRLLEEGYQGAMVQIIHNYLLCMHWSLAQLQGNADLYPGNSTTWNLLFVVLYSCVSIVALTLFVSNATDTLAAIRHYNQSELDEERLLKEFFSRHGIDPLVKHRADHFLALKKKRQKAIDAKDQDEEALLMFPKQIRSLLLAEIWAHRIVVHPLFAHLNKQARAIFVKVCSKVLSVRSYEPNEDAFSVGEQARGSHIILKGRFLVSTPVHTMFSTIATVTTNWLPRNRASRKSFQRTSQSSEDSEAHDELCWTPPVKKVAIGQLVSELSLWMPWVHVGDLCSTDYGQCLEISTEELIDIVKPRASQFVIFASFAQRFVNAAKYIKTQSQLNFIELMDFQHVLEVEAQLREDGDPDHRPQMERGKSNSSLGSEAWQLSHS